MPDGFALAVVAALAGKDTAVLAEGGLVEVIRERLRDETRALAAAPADPDRRLALAEALSRAMAADAEFAGRVRDRWSAQAVKPGSPVERGGVVNSFGGVAEKVVQARDVHGDITF